ncbi:RIP metalloprotease RseP [Aliikangiella maris]|uniref:Zinc metalloprotease n=2 Tax=Aliikangiella maris TaxID=3162458 RepID=A0ABV3MMQ5_9GAMM
MSELLWNAFYFIVTLGVLVTFHEYGHFWVARKLGVKVLTFSIGFGKPIWKRVGKDGVEYIIAQIPLGGYVKMLDSREGEIASEDKQYEFTQKPLWVRSAIILAGPVANFILAILLFWFIFVYGVTAMSSQLGKVEPESIIGSAGVKSFDTITRVDGVPVTMMQDVLETIARRMGENGTLELTVLSEKSSRQRTIDVSLERWQVDESRPDILGSLGIRHISYDKIIAQIDEVTDNSAASKADLRKNDIIRQFDGQKINNWFDLIRFTQAKAGKSAELQIERNGELINKTVVIGFREYDGKQVGSLGVSVNRPDLSPYMTTRQVGLWEGLGLAIEKTGRMISLTASYLLKMISGDISAKSLSGPFSIAEGAGGSARVGLTTFIGFIAMISVNLGFINLLPIPMLDGGHLMFFSIEAIKGKPLSEKAQAIGLQIGVVMVFALMAIAIFNDLSRLL